MGQRNESLSLALVEEQRKVIRPILSKHNGRETKTMGDAFLVEFYSALDAVRCAYDIQRAVRELNLSLDEDRRVHLRIGVHLGDVVESEGDISGDAVNVASRIEPLAEDDGVCISRQVYDHVQNKLELQLESIGSKQLKNVSNPLEVFRMVMPWERNRDAATVQFDMNRVAVLPFANMSPDPNDEYFADGMTEELIDRLAQMKGIEVIARTSVMSYKKKEKKVSEIAKELEAGSVVEGSVRKAGNRIRVTAQLIDGVSQGHVWSSHYDGSLDDIFAVQSEIAEKVAEELKIQLLQSERRTLEKKPTESLEAYSFFLQGKHLVHDTAESSLRQALKLFESAAAKDPSFARAYVGMAECHQWLGDFSYDPYLDSIKKAEGLLKLALQLDDRLAEAHEMLATIKWNLDEMEEVSTQAQIAIQLNPSAARAHLMLGGVKAHGGELIEGLRLVETAYRLDPLDIHAIEYVGKMLFWAGRKEEALEHWRRTEHLAPSITHRNLTEYYISQGDYGDATREVSELMRLGPSDAPNIMWRGYLAAVMGKKDEALKMIGKLEAKEDTWSAPIYFALGELDEFFLKMESSWHVHQLPSLELRYSPLYAGIRNDPRFASLLSH